MEVKILKGNRILGRLGEGSLDSGTLELLSPGEKQEELWSLPFHSHFLVPLLNNWWHTPGIAVFGRWKQKDQKFKTS